MPKLLIIADDLTGALDTAAQFANEGTACRVSVERTDDFRRAFERWEIISINAATRHLSPGEAGKTIQEIALEGRAAGVEFFYKKTDSTLRGNIGSELNALRVCVGNGRLAFVPAAPKLGRITRNGWHYVHGRLLHESSFAHDPRSPVRESFIPRIIAAQTDAPVFLLPRSEIEHAPVEKFEQEGIFVFDGESAEDLERTGACLQRHGLLRTVAAPASLAGILARTLNFQRTNRTIRLPEGPMLVVSGSVNEVALGQLARAAQAGWPVLAVPSEDLLAENTALSLQSEQIACRVAEQLQTIGFAVLSTAINADDVQQSQRLAVRVGLREDEFHERITRNLARIATRTINQTPPVILTVFGGDTLLALARERGWQHFLPEGEICPGVMHARIEEESRLHLIAKPGGFGSEDLLLQLRAASLNSCGACFPPPNRLPPTAAGDTSPA